LPDKTLPPQNVLLQLLDYDPFSGSLKWRERPNGPKWWNTKYAAAPALQSKWSNGYLGGAVLGKNYLAHRVIWKMITGQEAEEIDHINGDRTDNRRSNLRAVSRRENAKNKKRYANNSSGVSGIDFDKRRGVWRVRVGKKQVGSFESLLDATEARARAKSERGYHTNHGDDRPQKR